MNLLYIPVLAFQTPVAAFEDFSGEAIPLVAIVMPFLFVLGVLAITFASKYKTRKIRHETIRAMVEKGQPIPNELLTGDDDQSSKRHDDRKTGLILLAVGIGLFFFFENLNTGPQDGIKWVSLIPGLIGVALLLNWFLDRKSRINDSSEDK